MNTPDVVSRDTKAKLIMFCAECQLRGMIAENDERYRRGEALAYPEESFIDLSENTRKEIYNLQ